MLGLMVFPGLRWKPSSQYFVRRLNANTSLRRTVFQPRPLRKGERKAEKKAGGKAGG
jgi:hypothetical protein